MVLGGHTVDSWVALKVDVEGSTALDGIALISTGLCRILVEHSVSHVSALWSARITSFCKRSKNLPVSIV